MTEASVTVSVVASTPAAVVTSDEVSSVLALDSVVVELMVEDTVEELESIE